MTPLLWALLGGAVLLALADIAWTIRARIVERRRVDALAANIGLRRRNGETNEDLLYRVRICMARPTGSPTDLTIRLALASGVPVVVERGSLGRVRVITGPLRPQQEAALRQALLDSWPNPMARRPPAAPFPPTSPYLQPGTAH